MALTFKEYLGVLEPPAPLKLLEETHMAKALRLVQKKMDRFEAVDIAQVDIDQIAGELFALHGMDRLGEAKARNMRYAPYCLWAGVHPLIEEPGFLNSLLTLIDEKQRRSQMAALVHAFLQNYAVDEAGFARVGRFIHDRLSNWPQWSWAQPERARFFAEGGKPTQTLALEILQAKSDIWGFLDNLGLGADLSKGGFVTHAFRQAIKTLRLDLEVGKADVGQLERLFEWSGQNGNFNYPGCKIELAEALLEPFTDTAPAKQLEEKIKSFLVENYGDPRLGGAGSVGAGADGWIGVSEKARAVIRRWLVKTSIEQFLHIVDEMALERHWVYRKAFWKAYFKAEHISEAWVVFGPTGARIAEQAFLTTGDESWRSFGRFVRGSGFESNHAALILRIRDLIVVDWSHNGKCWIWNYSNPKAPSFYEQGYGANQLRKARFGQVHGGSDRYSWQFKVAEHIRQHTGIEMTREDYQIR